MRPKNKYVLLLEDVFDDTLGKGFEQTLARQGTILTYVEFELIANYLETAPSHVKFEAGSSFEAALWCFNAYPTVFRGSLAFAEFLKTSKGLSHLRWVNDNP